MELCSVCSQLVLPPPFLEEQILGPYDELLRKSRSLGPGRAGCGGCAFFSAIVGSSKRWCDRIPELLDSIIILIFNGLRVRASSGPIDLLREQTDGDLELKTYVVEEKTGVPQCNSYPDRRLVPSNPHESSCFDLISQWISQCTEHVDCSPPVPVALPKRVIEISNDRLVPPKLQITNGALGRYVILSHCWGSKGLMTLTKSLLPQYQEAISFELLPNSFRDAIEITRQLGFRYLWIDALCIVQNDTEDWAQEAGKMASYYGLSTLMISATAAEDSSKGILNPRKASHSPVLGQGKRGFLCPIPLQSHIDIDRSVLATRGWAAQERMLAPRVLHYTKQQMIWECAYGIFYEASDDEGHRPYHNAMYTKSKCQHFVTKAFSQEDTVPHYQDHNTKMPGRGFEDTSLERIETWHRCIAMYSSRSLTVPNDKLHAIAGVAKMLNHSGQLGEYLTGIWSTHLAYSLSWKSKLGNLSSPPSYTAPSWSWASVKGGVNRGIMYSRRPIDNANKSWTTRFYPKLIEQHIVSQDEHNVYGAVLEGSYIIVEGACLTRTDFDRILKTAFVTHHSGYHYGIYHDREDRAEGQPHDLGTSDYCMYLKGDAARGAELEFLLLCWVDQEASVAQRVGIAQITSYVAEQFIGIFEAANWERRTLKLV